MPMTLPGRKAKLGRSLSAGRLPYQPKSCSGISSNVEMRARLRIQGGRLLRRLSLPEPEVWLEGLGEVAVRLCQIRRSTRQE
jgi:hypothetical protein